MSGSSGVFDLLQEQMYAPLSNQTSAKTRGIVAAWILGVVVVAVAWYGLNLLLTRYDVDRRQVEFELHSMGGKPCTD